MEWKIQFNSKVLNPVINLPIIGNPRLCNPFYLIKAGLPIVTAFRLARRNREYCEENKLANQPKE